MESKDRDLLRAIDRKVDAIQEESETYVAERSEVLARLEALRSAFEETREDVKAIATKIWRGNGGSSILERLASLEEVDHPRASCNHSRAISIAAVFRVRNQWVLAVAIARLVPDPQFEK